MAPPRDLTIRPLGIGEVIDRAVALTRRHFRPLFLAMLVVQIPALAAYRAYSASLRDAFAALSLRPAASPPGLAGLAAGWVAFLALLSFLQICASAVAAAVVAPSLEGRAPGVPPPWGALARRAWPVATAAVAQMLVLAAAPLLGALPGLLLAWRGTAAATRLVGLSGAAAGAGLALLLALLRLAVAPAAAAVEGRAGLAALRRSSRLMAPRRGMPLSERPGLRASLLLLATFLLAAAVNALAGLPRAAAGLALGVPALAALPLAAEVALTLAEALANAAVQPFSLVALAVFYFDRRARLEALDLEIWAERLAEGRAGA